MPIVALSGFMGSGKTVVGRGLAELLGWRFVDLDEQIERRMGLTVRRIFDEQGEAAFRWQEVRSLRDVIEAAGEAGVVVALGGGTVTLPEAARLLDERATVVHLDVPPVEAWRRVAGTDRPLAGSFEEFHALAHRRELVYRDTADAVVWTGGRSVDDVIGETAAIVGAGTEVVAETDPGAEARPPGETHPAGGGRAAAPGGGSTAAGRGVWRLEVGTSKVSQIVGGVGAAAELGARSAGPADAGLRGFVISDRTVLASPAAASVLERLAPGFLGAEPLAVEAGEASKDVATAAVCWQWLAEHGARRDDIVIALGGGVVGDLAGLVAATYLRGVRLWQVPTTLLAQVDSSVGGKVAIDLPHGKNLVGAFYQPELVVIDPGSLRSLPGDQLRAGLGEVVKYGLLDEAGTLDLLETTVPWVLACVPRVLDRLVRRCVEFKAAVVVEDETDRGRRAILNLGHTAAHALEAVLGYGTMPHGCAVGLGLLVALAVSEEEVGLDPGVRLRVRRLLERLGLPVDVDLPPMDRLVQAAARDKKATAAGSGFVCLESIGRPVWGVPVSPGRLALGLEVIRR